MRSFHVLLLLTIFIFAIISVFLSGASENPADEARVFLSKVTKSDIAGALQEFGDNTCHCAPKGGYAAYLQYAAAQEPNIAFMLGQQSVVYGTPRIKKLPYNGSTYMLPWDRPEDVVVYLPVEFPDASTRPYLLPMDSAFGYEISQNDLLQFIQSHNTEEWVKALTLRMRSSLKPGLVKPRDPGAEETDVEKAAREGLLPADLAKYIHPADAGTVRLSSGSSIPIEQFGQQLPRLKSIVIGMKVVRRGSFKRWAIKKIAVMDAVVLTNGQEFKIIPAQMQDSPKAEAEQPAAEAAVKLAASRSIRICN